MRHLIAISQVAFSALLIHVTGGRLETHFHIFGSLAFLAAYRDWTVLVPSTLLVALDHLMRGIYLPESSVRRSPHPATGGGWNTRAGCCSKTSGW